MPSPDASAAHSVGHAKSALEATDDSALRALGEQLARVRWPSVTDVSTELGDYLAGLPSDASTLEAKLARQGELRTLTRKYAADIDGVLRWAHESRDRLVQLDVSEDALAELERRVGELEAESRQRRNRTHQGADQGRQGPREGGDRRADGPGHGRRRVHGLGRRPSRPARTTPHRSPCRRV